MTFFCNAVFFLQPFLLKMTESIRRWKPCWILIDDAFKKWTWRTGNFLKNWPFCNPSMILHRHFLLLPIRHGYEDRRTKTNDTVKHEQPWDASSAPRSFWTPLLVTSTVLRCDASTGTISVPLKKLCRLRFADASRLPTLWGPRSIPGNGAEVCGFTKTA